MYLIISLLFITYNLGKSSSLNLFDDCRYESDRRTAYRLTIVDGHPHQPREPPLYEFKQEEELKAKETREVTGSAAGEEETPWV